jgi:hypothetical protein
VAALGEDHPFYTGRRFNRHTILEDGIGQIAGRLGEAEFAKQLCLYAPSFLWVGTEKGSYDFVVKLRDGQKITIDVKTKHRNVEAKPHYSAHVTLSQKEYEVHIYVFANEVEGEVELMGWCSKQWFWGNAQVVSAGDVESKQTQFVERDGAGKVSYESLRPMSEMWEKLKPHTEG